MTVPADACRHKRLWICFLRRSYPHPLQRRVYLGFPEPHGAADLEVRDQSGHAPAVEVAYAHHQVPPDLQEEAVKTVLMQAELLCAEWV